MVCTVQPQDIGGIVYEITRIIHYYPIKCSCKDKVINIDYQKIGDLLSIGRNIVSKERASL